MVGYLCKTHHAGYASARIAFLGRDVKGLNHLKSNRRRSVKSQKIQPKNYYGSASVTASRSNQGQNSAILDKSLAINPISKGPLQAILPTFCWHLYQTLTTMDDIELAGQGITDSP
jgi:hypothetical protein